jgi:predicted dehydrogenase
MTTVGVLGYGYWSPILVKNFATLDCRIKRIVDRNTPKLEAAQALYPGVITSKDMDDVFSDSEIDAVVITLPANLHYETAKKALLAGKHVLIEKPMTDSVETALELLELAEKSGLVLMVDHHFLYKDSVRELKKIADSGELGKLQYFDATRINLGLFRPDVNVMWDLASHDISIIQYILGKDPVSVAATGKAHFENQQENIAFITLFYEDDFIAHINVSWSSPIKDRTVLLGGDKGVALFDDAETSEKLRVYEVNYEMKQKPSAVLPFVVCSSGNVRTPEPDTCNALKNVCAEFLRCIEEHDCPESGGDFGLAVIRVLDAADQSLRANGKEVFLK